jgi:prenyltransferase beta subunit
MSMMWSSPRLDGACPPGLAARCALAARVASVSVCLGGLGATGWTARADAPAPVSAAVDYTPETAEAVARGLHWLGTRQSKSGAFGSSQVPVAATGVAGLAFLANGNVPGRGRYAQQVKGAIRYLLECQKQSHRGYIEDPNGNGSSRMHGHGYATLFLGEVLGMTNDETDGLDVHVLREAVKKAVQLIEQSQSKDGGWTYTPDPNSGDEGSVTVTQVQALRSARNAGIKVNKSTIDRAVTYIQRSANPDGGIRYSLSSGGSHSSFALTAAGVSVMNYLGEYNMPQIDRGIQYLVSGMKRGGANRGRGHFQAYEEFYATLAFYQQGGECWRKNGPALRDEILKRRAPDGTWQDGYGAEFGTAFAVLTLQIPNQYLPIFQR